MAKKDEKTSVHQRWAHLRFSVVGPLLAGPPRRGELWAELERLALRAWLHPVSGEPTRFAASTIERWLYQARHAHHDPVAALRRKVRKDQGQQVAMGEPLKQSLLSQYAAHKGWSAKLHFDNLVALAEAKPELGTPPSYSTVRRFLKANGLFRKRQVSSVRTEGTERAEARLMEREVRSYEAEYVNGLWHWDCHICSRKVLVPSGQWATPVLFGVLDDRSRVAAHLQWYLAESAENIAHGLSQAFQKRGLPRAALSDNGAAMTAAEIEEGLGRLGVVHETTLPHSPYQNGKQESFWGQVEGRLMAMLEEVEDLTLSMLNEATQAWVEYEYNRAVHSEIGEAPLARFLRGPDVSRPSRDSAGLRLAFTRTEARSQRRSDGTLSLESRRFEVPSRYRHMERLSLRYASWDLTQVHLVDERTGQVLCRLYPEDKTRNASGLRRPLEPVSAQPAVVAKSTGLPPLLTQLMRKQAASGLPPAYLPKDEGDAP